MSMQPPAPPQGASDSIQALFEHVPDLLCTVDFEGRFVHINPAFTRCLGYPPEELIGRPFEPLVHPEDHDPTVAEFEARKQPTERGRFVNRLRCRDGSYRRFAWLSATDPMRRAIYGAGTDITSLDWLRGSPPGDEGSDRELAPFFDLSLDLLCIATFDGYFKRLNPAFTRLLGYTIDELTQLPFMYFVHPDDLRSTHEAMERLNQGENVIEFENRYRHKDGSWRWLLWQSAPDRERRLHYAVAHDITERRLFREQLSEERNKLENLVRKRTAVLERTVAELRSERERYAAVVENPVVGVAVHRDGRLLFANGTLAKMFGFDSASALVGIGDLSKLFSAADYQRIREHREAVLLGRVHAPFIQVQGLRQDGKPLWLDKVAIPIVWEGEPAIQSAMIDVTGSKSLEEQLQQAQKMETIGNLAGGIAHDFNNMLSVIVSYSGMLADQLDGGSQARQDVDEIRHAADRAAALTRQLLTFSRRQVQKTETLDLNGVIRETEKMLRRLIGEQVVFVTRLEEGLWPVRADASQIEQVIMNLAVNARDAMPNGGTLSIQTANVQIDENYASQNLNVHVGPYVALSVTDSGTGMSDEVRRRIFEPFFTTKEQGKGTGLGLATVYGIVKQSGGDIHVYSELGHGTTFRVYLPRASETAAAEDAAPLEAELPGGKETILLVEDEAPVRRAARRILERAGYTVLEARGGAEALLLSESFSGVVNLLVTDVVMPQMSGREIAEKLRLARPGLRVLFMSGYTDDAILRHHVINGSTHFLQKPFSRDLLLRGVRKALDSMAPATDPGAGRDSTG